MQETQHLWDKAKKYAIRSISEIFFVLVGILLALQINNWNFNRKQQQTLHLHLANLKAELIQDQQRLAHVKVIHEFKYEGFQYLLNLAGEPKYNPSFDQMSTPVLGKDNPIWEGGVPITYNQEFIDQVFLWSHRVDIFQTTRTTIDEMNNLGTYSLISNQLLKASIIDYYDSWEGRLRILMRDLIEDWQKSLEKDGIITSTVYRLEDPIALIRNNPERIGKLNRLTRECVWWHDSAIYLTELSDQIITLIDEEISQ